MMTNTIIKKLKFQIKIKIPIWRISYRIENYNDLDICDSKHSIFLQLSMRHPLHKTIQNVAEYRKTETKTKFIIHPFEIN